MNEVILRHPAGAVQVMSINNSTARNAVTRELCAALLAALAEAQADPDIGAIVLTGVGNVFRIGGDLGRCTKRPTPPLELRTGIERLHDVIRSIRSCSKPMIAAVEGSAFGADLSIALACDMLVAARNASFCVTYGKVGLSPDGRITALLTDFVSGRVLTELCLAGEHVTGECLHGLGVVNRLADPGVR